MDGKTVNYVSAELNIPMFMVTRKKVQNEYMANLKNHLEKKKTQYIKSCHKDSYTNSKRSFENMTLRSKAQKTCAHITPSVKHNDCVNAPCRMPPIFHTTNKEPFEHKKGLKGAYIAKVHTTKPRKTRPTRLSSARLKRIFSPNRGGNKKDLLKNDLYFENIFGRISLSGVPLTLEPADEGSIAEDDINLKGNSLVRNRCNKYKGHFVTNARSRRPSTRFMVFNLTTCYKHPDLPGPTKYEIRKVTTNFLKRKSRLRPNPHLFYPSSCVPMKKGSVYQKHLSFAPGPGRYESHPISCPCPRGRIYQPGLHLLLALQKRNKFWDLPTTSYNTKRYCNPDWRHVKGQGFPHLFKEPRSTKKKIVRRRYTSPIGITRHKYKAGFEQKTHNMSTFNYYEEPEINIRFNRIVKVTRRRQLRINSRVAFGSGMRRFQQEGYKTHRMTRSEYRVFRTTLARDRIIRNYPIMNRKKDEITPRYQEIPSRKKLDYIPKLRRKIFKFLPVPDPKLLVTDGDLQKHNQQKPWFYMKPLKLADFLYRDASENDSALLLKQI